jgi:hypothetical protein
MNQMSGNPGLAPAILPLTLYRLVLGPVLVLVRTVQFFNTKTRWLGLAYLSLD